MKKIVSLIIIVGLAVLAYVAAGPFITLYQLNSALENNDAAKLSNQVDFARLRQNLKAQYGSETLTAEQKTHWFERLKAKITDAVSDPAIDAAISPTGLKTILKAQNLFGSNDTKPKDGSANTTNESKAAADQQTTSLSDLEFHYKSLNEFSVKIPQDHQKITLELYRDGLSWKLSNVILGKKSKIKTE